MTNSEKKRISRILLIASDSLALIFVSSFFYDAVSFGRNLIDVKITTFLGLVAFVGFVIFWLGAILAHYSSRRSFYDEFKDIVYVMFFCGLLGFSSLFLSDFPSDKFKHIYFLIFGAFNIILTRYIIRRILFIFNYWSLDCLLICDIDEFLYAKRALESQFTLGMKVLPLDERCVSTSIPQKNLIEIKSDIYNNYDYFLKLYHEYSRPHIIVALRNLTVDDTKKIIDHVMQCGCDYSIIPEIGGASLLGTRISHFLRWETLLLTPRNNLNRASFVALKRVFDIMLSLILAVVFLPLFVVVIVCNKLDGGPVFFSQKRVGKGGNEFSCYKFRTMVVDAEILLSKLLENNADLNAEWQRDKKLKNDPRITKIGYYMRRFSIDEIPQLWNVIIGDMSLVGPRPVIVDELQHYGRDVFYYMLVRPGLTGLWQISGRSDTSYNERVKLDTWYVKNWSLWYDIAILARTIIVVIQRDGAY